MACPLARNLTLPPPSARCQTLRVRAASAGGASYSDNCYVEYDLDAEDEAWLVTYNADQNRLKADKFERMIWRLELANAEATIRVLESSGAYQAERVSAAAVAAIDHMPKRDAMEMLKRSEGEQLPLLTGSVVAGFALLLATAESRLKRKSFHTKPPARRLLAASSFLFCV